MKVLIVAFFIFASQAFSAKPKYGPEATLLSESHEYIQKHPAPDYWALSPYYLPQFKGWACSVASTSMVLNALRHNLKLTSDDKLVTQEELVKKVADPAWHKAPSLEKLRGLVEQSLKAYNLKGYVVEVHHMSESPGDKEQLHKDLIANEKSDKDFILANFLQGTFTGDAEIGHYSPVATYDEDKHRVLVMDVDREWYEPYWVSEDVFAKGMATADKDAKKNRGYLYIKAQ